VTQTIWSYITCQARQYDRGNTCDLYSFSRKYESTYIIYFCNVIDLPSVELTLTFPHGALIKCLYHFTLARSKVLGLENNKTDAWVYFGGIKVTQNSYKKSAALQRLHMSHDGPKRL